MNRILEGQVAVVTGAARGIGLEICRRLGSAGAAIAMIDVDKGALAAAAERLTSSGISVVSEEADVSNAESVNAAFGSILKALGPVDILVNNAGIFPRHDFEDLSYEIWRHVLAVNLDSVFLCTKAVYPCMSARRYGRIINLSSSTVFIGPARRAAYVASKAAVIGLTRSLATEFGPYTITVNVVCPGLIETEGAHIEDPDGRIFDRVLPQQAVGRRGRPTDIAEAVAYLASPASGFITGQVINVDGGHRFL